MKNPVYVELTFAKSRKLPGVPAKYQFIQDAMEQLTLCKYKGRPHWYVLLLLLLLLLGSCVLCANSVIKLFL
jgi:hypothetical protein